MKRKSELQQDKKGYMQLDFLFASLIFFIFLFTVYSQIDSRIDELDNRFEALRIKGYARDICYLLTQTPGYPINWEEGDVDNPDYIGLYNKTTGTLETQKINGLTFSIYRTILDNMDLDAFLRVEIRGLETDTLYKEFGINNNDGLSIFENYICYSNYNDEIVRFRFRAPDFCS